MVEKHIDMSAFGHRVNFAAVKKSWSTTRFQANLGIALFWLK